MTPPPDSDSPLATLRQLKEMLDTGAITPQEFEALKQRLIFGTSSPSPPPAETDLGNPTPTPVSYDLSEPAEDVNYPDTPSALTPEATLPVTPEPDWLASPAPALLNSADESVVDDLPVERRNPLNLVFAIGGLLLFLGVVLFLALDRTPTADEHLTSGSQTAADTTSVVPEVGPQAEQLTLPAAAPETIRVAPATAPIAAPVAVDSSAIPSATSPSRVPASAPAKTATPAPAPAAPASPAADTANAGRH